MYRCEKCNKDFEKRSAYIGHCSSHNRGESYKKGRKKIKDIEIISLDCKYCGTSFSDSKKLGGHTGGCKLNPNYKNRNEKLSNIGKNKRLSDETKKKISTSRKKFLDENPGSIPYLLNHSSKESYPEKLFRLKLEKENIIGWIQEYPILRYSLDFAFIDKKINIEIDGGTHKINTVLKKDMERDLILKEMGWKIIRIDANTIKNNIDDVFNSIITDINIKTQLLL
jgi:very-short-patch-repair endonuclease